MAKKKFEGINTEPVYTTIAEATEEPETVEAQPIKKQRKPVETYSPERVRQMQEAGTTRGRKGCKANRVNMAFTPEIHDYIRTMARVRGESITDFTNYVFRKSMEENAAIYEQAKAFKNSF